MARTIDGRLVELPTRGKVTLVDYWGTFCVPCRAALPRLQTWSQRWVAQGLLIVGVASDDNPGLVAETVKQLGVSYANVLDDGDRTLGRVGAVSQLPTTLVFDRRGRLRYVARGRPDRSAEPHLDALEAVLPALLAEQE
jgi:thiol-disulfide isomerase/thioredoxin